MCARPLDIGVARHPKAISGEISEAIHFPYSETRLGTSNTLFDE